MANSLFAGGILGLSRCALEGAGRVGNDLSFCPFPGGPFVAVFRFGRTSGSATLGRRMRKG